MICVLTYPAAEKFPAKNISMEPLTDKQREILQVIRDHMEERGYSPTVREIGTAVHLSSSCTVQKHLDNLEAKGYIRRDRYKRSLELMEDGQPVSFGRAVRVPLLGRVAGGPGIYTDPTASASEWLPLPTTLMSRGDVSGRDLFAMHVHGDSMRNVGIMNGDIVVAKKQATARDGEIVIALINDDETTVKTFYKEPNGFRLQPENPDFQPIITKDATILGRVTMAIKQF
jgi:repressor LexA